MGAFFFFQVCTETGFFSSPCVKYICIKPYHDADLNILLKDFFLQTHGINKVDYKEAVNDCF